MHKTLTTVLVAGLLLVLAVPALASHPYVGAASARGIQLSLGEQDLEVGFTEAAVQSGPSDDGCGSRRGNACARAAGAVTAAGTAQAHAPGSGGPRDVAAADLPDALGPLLSGRVGAARAQATSEAHARTARGSAGGLGLSLTATVQVADSRSLHAALQTVAASLPAAPEQGEPDALLEAIRTAVDQLLVDPTAAPLVDLTGGTSTAAASDLGGVTTTTATTGETTLVLVPTLRSTPEEPEGLVVVEVGAASASASSDQRRATAEVDAPPVTLSVYDPEAGAYDVREVAAGESACAASGTPLETCVAVGAGQEAVEGAGAAASLPGVTVRSLAPPLPTLELGVGEARAAVASAPPRPAPSTPVPSRRLPATGGGDPVLPDPGAALVLVGLGAAALGAVGLLRRRA